MIIFKTVLENHREDLLRDAHPLKQQGLFIKVRRKNKHKAVCQQHCY